ncbi:MAG: tRNA pseudouridine(38-40) synthase TruA [Eudoraea sp.]|nr:tRNA pseudouridine(38-40) synthase TruA [Eudoraea sp.]
MERQYYLIRIQYLGFRYSGWQRQPGQKTVEGMLLKTLKFVLPDRRYKILGSSRTDAKVSSMDGAFELFLEGIPIPDLTAFQNTFNRNLPPDIRITTINPVDKEFNIINDSRHKVYHYLFATAEKLHPFCAPFMACFTGELDIKRMQEGASLFEGTHDFGAYTPKSENSRELKRTLNSCVLRENTQLKASFFPRKSYVLKVGASGFARYQVRMIMGALVSLGRGALTKDQIRQSLSDPSSLELTYIAPGSGLHLHQLEFKSNS